MVQRDEGDGHGASERPGQAGPSTNPEPETALTRGFLFCDLRGYTAFVEDRGDRAAVELLAAFRKIVREAIAATRGGEVRTEGDSFYVVFPSASAAVRCGLAISEAAASTNAEQPDRLIRVGVGIHAGESIEHREGFIGSAVNIAARVCALASAGEVLVTDTVRSLVRTSLDVTFVARGRRHLKGITEPIALYAVTSAPSFANGKARGRAVALGPRAVRRGLLLSAVLALGVVAVSIGVSMLGGVQGLPAALPGQLVFLASAREQQVYLALPNGDERHRLTPLSENVSQFVVRPDSGAIAYVAGDQIGIASLSDAGGSSRWPGTWGLPEFNQGSGLVDIDLIAWLPSGELLLEEGRPDRVKATLAANGESMTTFTVGPCVGDANSASGTDLAISSDGRSIAYQAGQDLWIAPIGGCGIRVSTSIDASKPAWSPDGSHLAFQGLTDESGGIYVVSANGTGLRQLTADASNDTDPAWAPDGAYIAWTRTVDSVGRLWVMHADGSGQRQLPIGNAGERLDHPIWIPKADLIPTPSATPAVPNPFEVDGTYSAESLGLDRPLAMAVGPDGHVYITDMTPSVTVFDAFGSFITKWGSAGSGRSEFNFGTDTPHGSIALDSSSRVYVSDSLNARVQVFDATGEFLRQFGSPGTADGEFVWPFDLSVDDQGNVYVLDDGARNLQKFSPDGKFIWKVDNSTLPDFTGHGHGANIDPQGRIVIGIDDNGRVIFLDEDGHEVDAFNAGACEVTVDPAGNIYVVDVGCGGETVAVFDPSLRLIGRWQGPAMPLGGAPEFGPNGEVFALGKDGSLIRLAIHLNP